MTTKTKKPSNRLLLQDVRCTWIFVNKPRPKDDDDDDDDDKKDDVYECEILLHKRKQKSQIAKLTKAIKAAADKEGFRGNKWRNPLKDGDEFNEDAENPRDYYKDHMFIKTKTYYKPGVVTKTGEPAMPEDWAEMGFSGCFFHVSVTIKGYNVVANKVRNKGIKAQLGNMMMRKIGERLDGRVSAENEFADYVEDDDDDDEDWEDDED